MIVPRVYSFVPGALTGAAFVNGINRVLISGNPHYWRRIDFTNNVEVTAENMNTGQRVRYVAQAANVQVFYAPDGVNYSPGSLMDNFQSFTSTDYRLSTLIAYIVELEDAITVFGIVNDPGGNQPTLPNALSVSAQAGRIFSPINRSDDIMSHGIMSGYAGVYNNSTWMWLGTSTTAGGNTQSYVQTRSGWERVCCPSPLNRHKRLVGQPAMIENIGDDADIERLAPFPVTGPVSGTLGGHFGFTRYMRARKHGWGDNVGGFTIDNFTVANSDTDPNIAWKHSYFVNFTAIDSTVINVIHIWQQAPVQHIT